MTRPVRCSRVWVQADIQRPVGLIGMQRQIQRQRIGGEYGRPGAGDRQPVDRGMQAGQGRLARRRFMPVERHQHPAGGDPGRGKLVQRQLPLADRMMHVARQVGIQRDTLPADAVPHRHGRRMNADRQLSLDVNEVDQATYFRS
ncbi:hypothetical protein [Gluconacetobacter diazotrophicus]|uniref:hypothetical protein n=1 Tax=Gluconacetobacter diazotrophicus TaxID=33996 RepID=UPI001FCC08DA|nr:hypothetical protein [Gluconacetobacter diazotrophicus]